MKDGRKEIDNISHLNRRERRIPRRTWKKEVHATRQRDLHEDNWQNKEDGGWDAGSGDTVQYRYESNAAIQLNTVYKSNIFIYEHLYTQNTQNIIYYEISALWVPTQFSYVAARSKKNNC